ncbi:MAG: hypothetical protein AB8B80_15275 [Marinicellaceae bacterium]
MKFFLLLFLFSLNSQAELIKAKPFDFSKHHGSVTDFTPLGTQPDLSFDLESASSCSSCHGGATADPSDNEYMPFATWAGSMMANSARDPLFWAAVDVANQDIPGVGDFCIRCHTPMGFYNGHTKDGTGDPSYYNGCELTGSVVASESKLNDYQGINCHFCHRQEENGPNNEPQIIQNSNVWIDDEVCDNPELGSANGPCRKGPYDDYATNPEVGSPPHEWERSNFLSESEFCGSCHNVSSPEILTDGVLSFAKSLIDTDGNDTGIAMPIERTFNEWKSSMFSDLIFTDGNGGDEITEFPHIVKGETCQTCHMPKSESLDARACVFNGLGARAGELSTHEFAGGNTWMPEVLKNLYGEELSTGNFDRSAAFDRTIMAAMNMLQNKSALIETEISNQTDSLINVNVKVTNLTGHKLPTGYLEGRRMWINVVASDDNGAVIYENGGYDEKTAELDLTGAKVYESIQGIWDGNSCVTSEDIPNPDGKGLISRKLFHFVLNNCIEKDNRIPPLGFTGINDIEMQPVNYSYPARPGYPNQSVNYDITPYEITIPKGAALPITVTSTLKFQVASKDYIEFLESESTTVSENELCNNEPPSTVGPADQSRGDFMKSLWETYGKSAPVDMVTSTTQTSTEL